MGNPISWICNSLGSERRRYGNTAMNGHPPFHAHNAGCSCFPPDYPLPYPFNYPLHTPHHRDAFPTKGILRTGRRPHTPRMTRPRNPGVQGRRPPPPADAQNAPLMPPANPQAAPQYYPPTFPFPFYYLPDGTTFIPSYVIPGTITAATPNGPVTTPALVPGLLPTSTIPTHASTTFPLPFLTPNMPTFPMNTPATPFATTRQRSSVEVCCPLGLPTSNGASVLEWDIWRKPSSALRRNNRGNFFRLDNAELRSPATLPAADSITVTCREGIIGQFWPDIEVLGSPVTIENILDAIYDHFHTEVEETEYRQMSEMDGRNSTWMVQAMHHRCLRANQLFENIWRVGLKRIDCLGDTHEFKGLQVEYLPNDRWQLVLHLGWTS